MAHRVRRGPAQDRDRGAWLGSLVLSFSNLASDPRVDRQLAALMPHHEIVAAGLVPPRREVEDFIDISTPPRGTLGKALGLSRLLVRRYESVYWKHPTNRAVLERLRDLKVDAVVANELAALPLALRLGAPVIFDAHEYSPAELTEKLWWRAILAPFVRWQCRRYMPLVAAITTVCRPIADEYERLTGVRPIVVTNAAPYADFDPTPVHEPVRILHHGGAMAGRKLEQMIRVADLLDERFTLDLVLVETTPGYRDELICLAEGNPRVRFPSPVPMQELVPSGKRLRPWALPPASGELQLSQRAAQNKLLSSSAGWRSRSALGQMARLVREHGLGIVAADFRPETLAAALNALDTETIAAFKKGRMRLRRSSRPNRTRNC